MDSSEKAFIKEAIFDTRDYELMSWSAAADELSAQVRVYGYMASRCLDRHARALPKLMQIEDLETSSKYEGTIQGGALVLLRQAKLVQAYLDRVIRNIERQMVGWNMGTTNAGGASEESMSVDD